MEAPANMRINYTTTQQTESPMAPAYEHIVRIRKLQMETYGVLGDLVLRVTGQNIGEIKDNDPSTMLRDLESISQVTEANLKLADALREALY